MLATEELGEDSFSIGGFAAKTMRYAVKVDIGGEGGPVWQIELASSIWPKGDSGQKR
jgi:hypothetical protein